MKDSEWVSDKPRIAGVVSGETQLRLKAVRPGFYPLTPWYRGLDLPPHCHQQAKTPYNLLNFDLSLVQDGHSTFPHSILHCWRSFVAQHHHHGRVSAHRSKTTLHSQPEVGSTLITQPGQVAKLVARGTPVRVRGFSLNVSMDAKVLEKWTTHAEREWYSLK